MHVSSVETPAQSFVWVYGAVPRSGEYLQLPASTEDGEERCGWFVVHGVSYLLDGAVVVHGRRAKSVPEHVEVGRDFKYQTRGQ